jgi:hypothetical protein
MVPDLPPDPLQLVVERGLGQVALFLELSHGRGNRLCKFFIIKVHYPVELNIVAVHDTRSMASVTDVLHLAAPILPG